MSTRPADLPEADAPPLVGRLSFAIHQLSAQMARIVNPLFREYGVDVVSSRILVMIMEAGTLGAGRLVEALMLPQSTISHQIQRLEAKGYVVRERAAGDQRMVTLRLTEAGRAVAEACDRMSVDVYEAMVETLTPEQAEAARTALDAMLAGLARLRRPAE